MLSFAGEAENLIAYAKSGELFIVIPSTVSENVERLP